MKVKMKLAVIVLSVYMLLSISGVSYAVFTDINGHWAENLITKWGDRGLATGYGSGTFQPDAVITRAEFVTLVNKAFGFEEAAQLNFTDVPAEAWFAVEISRALDAKYITGYGDGTFRPNNSVTREEAALMIASVLALEAPKNDNLGEFTDAQNISAWSKTAVNALVAEGIMSGYPDNTFRPAGFLTRAEVISILDRGLQSLAASIGSINATNGSIDVKLDRKVTGLTADDFAITAKLDEKPYTLQKLYFNAEKNSFSFTPVAKNGFTQVLELTVSAGTNTYKVTGMADFKVTIGSNRGGGGGGSAPASPPNTAPTTPIITRTPSTSYVSITDMVTITAASTDAEGDAITYIWTGRLAETSQYPAGRQVITVKAVDEHGMESQQAAIIFFAIDGASGSGGMVLTGPESRIYENGIDGATITGYTFNVPPVSGHSGDDYGQVKGLNIITHEWDQLDYQSVSNGVYFARTLDPGKYSRLDLYYYTNHDCMYNKSNITYTVEFAFGGLPPGTPPEAAPNAADVEISGNAVVGRSVTGDYTFADVNGDLEGTSTFQWYRADDAAGTNKTAIAGATSGNYTLDVVDENKFITFEVTPVALTGVTGTITGTAVQSQPVLIIAEAAPAASNVMITGVEQVGNILTGSYNYSDANGDLEGTSTFQWYRADDAAGTNMTAIAGATSAAYTLDTADEDMYIFFEVTPVADAGVLTGASVLSAATAQVVSVPV